MQAKRILIVDDQPNIALMIAASLENLGKSYAIEVAHNGDDALEKLQQANYELLITDYNMPGLNGLDLTQAARHISPHTQVVLMTAYGTDKLRHVVGDMKLDGYLDKPFSIEQIREIVERMVRNTQAKKANAGLCRTGEQIINETTKKHLKSLQLHTHARCVLLISSSGYPVCTIGATKNLDVTNISALVAANFLASIELANLLGSNTSIFKSSYHEGNDYNIYSYDINGELLIAVIFGTESKPGLVWFYTKQTVLELEPLVANQTHQVAFTEDVVDAALDIGFDNLFGASNKNNNELNQFNDDDNSNNEPNLLGHKVPHNNTSIEKKETEKNKPMTFKQAVAAGLVPPNILNREQKHLENTK
jgi:CheY-like chemotaxis protein